MANRIGYSILFSIIIAGCVSQTLRLPQSVDQVYSKNKLQQGLLLAANNSILFSIPDSTLHEVEKIEIDLKCRTINGPVWDKQLSRYLSEFEKYPEILNKIHILEIKRGDKPQISIQKDLDGAVTASIEFVKIETQDKVDFKTHIPCAGQTSDYYGHYITKTDYDFPATHLLTETLKKLPDRLTIERLNFNNGFLNYLAERGAFLKFSHELSFEKYENKKFAFAEIMNLLSEQVKNSFHQYTNYWFQQISQKSKQAELFQMFALVADSGQKRGIKVEVESEQSRKTQGQMALTYLYTGYSLDENHLKLASLDDLNTCLKKFAESMATVSFRKPASVDKETYLRPGFSCADSSTMSMTQPPQ